MSQQGEATGHITLGLQKNPEKLRLLLRPQRTDWVYFGRLPGRVQALYPTDNNPYGHPIRNIHDAVREEEIGHVAYQRTHDGIADHQTADLAGLGPDDLQDEGFIQEHSPHFPYLYTHGEVDTNLSHPLVDRHHHPVKDTDSRDH